MDKKIAVCKSLMEKALKGEVVYVYEDVYRIMQDVIFNYYLPKMNSIDIRLLTLEDCFILYHNKDIACECDADNERIYFVEG